jgi:hypothetical protein
MVDLRLSNTLEEAMRDLLMTSDIEEVRSKPHWYWVGHHHPCDLKPSVNGCGYSLSRLTSYDYGRGRPHTRNRSECRPDASKNEISESHFMSSSRRKSRISIPPPPTSGDIAPAVKKARTDAVSTPATVAASTSASSSSSTSSNINASTPAARPDGGSEQISDPVVDARICVSQMLFPATVVKRSTRSSGGNSDAATQADLTFPPLCSDAASQTDLTLPPLCVVCTQADFIDVLGNELVSPLVFTLYHGVTSMQSCKGFFRLVSITLAILSRK